jgi:hypothetical protein
VIEEHRVMKCPGLDCHRVFEFTDLSEDEQRVLVENRDDYKID